MFKRVPKEKEAVNKVIDSTYFKNVESK